MSNIHNDRIKEDIMEDLEATPLHEFQELLNKHHYSDLNNHIDVAVSDLIEISFQERCE